MPGKQIDYSYNPEITADDRFGALNGGMEHGVIVTGGA